MSDVLKRQPVDHRKPSIQVTLIKQGLEECFQSQSSTQNILQKRNFTLYGDNNDWTCWRDILLRKDDNVTNKALLIKGDTNGFVNSVPPLERQYNKRNNLKLVSGYCTDNGCYKPWPLGWSGNKYGILYSLSCLINYQD